MHTPQVRKKLSNIFISSAAAREYEDLPRKVKQKFMVALEAISYGQQPTIPFEHLDDGLVELKINGSPAWRCLYSLKAVPEQVTVVSAFKKTTNGPAHQELKTARARLRKAGER